jgi:ribonuclease VapC
MHVDASALVAILLGEPERVRLIEALAASEARRTSVVSAFEAVIAVGRVTGDRHGAVDIVTRLLRDGSIEIEDADAPLLAELSEAHARYGKGSGHPARLNLGDCFSYAMARRAGTGLLYKGEDFARTDLA